MTLPLRRNRRSYDFKAGSTEKLFQRSRQENIVLDDQQSRRRGFVGSTAKGH